MHVVKDGLRELKFEGEELASSSSKTPDKARWIEFRLYKTRGGEYVLSRIGHTLLYHAGYCDVVSRNGLYSLPSIALGRNMVPCPRCKPSPQTDTDLFPEMARYWAIVSKDPTTIVESLQRTDEELGVTYYTSVAQRLLLAASKKDEGIKDNFFTEWID